MGSLVAVVDDDESVRDSLPDLLKEFGFAVQAFSSAEEFLASGYVSQTRCLILDIAMPGMSGPDLQRELMLRRQQIPIVFITAHGDETVRPRVLEQGAVECLIKPFSDTALREAVRAALRVTWAIRRALAPQNTGEYHGSRERGWPWLRVISYVARYTNRVRRWRRRNRLPSGLFMPDAALRPKQHDQETLRQTREIMGVIRDVASRGRSLVLAIHQLVDAERVCDRFVLLGDGQVRGHAGPEQRHPEIALVRHCCILMPESLTTFPQ
jgi:DNA-binding response OmpR family regulator